VPSSKKCSSQNRTISTCGFRKTDRFRSACRKAKNQAGCSSEGSAKENSMHSSFRSPWNREPWNLRLQTQKADRFRSAPYSRKIPILAAF